MIYGDTKSTTIVEASTAKWKMMKKKSFVCLTPDADSLHHHYLYANYLAYLICHPSLLHHLDMVGGHCRPVHHTQLALPMHIPAPVPAEVNKEDETEEVGYDIYT